MSSSAQLFATSNAIASMKLLFAAMLAIFSQMAIALSHQNAWLNIFYFEHARHSSSHCEKLGFSTGSALTEWQAKNASLFRESMAIARADAGKRGLHKPEQELAIAEGIENQKKIALDHIRESGVKCTRFDSILRMYDELFIR